MILKVLPLLLAFSAIAEVKDIGLVGPDGMTTLLFEKNGSIYLRTCPKHEIIATRKDCKNSKEYPLVSTAELKQRLKQVAPSALQVTSDPEFKNKHIQFLAALDELQVAKLEERRSKIIAFKNQFGENSYDKYELAEIEKKLNANKTNLDVAQKVKKTIDAVYAELTNKEVIYLDNTSGVFQKDLVLALFKNDLGDIPLSKRCRFEPSAPGTFNIYVDDDYKGKCLPDSNTLGKTYHCSALIRNYPECNIASNVDHALDASISDVQRFEIKDKPVPTSPGAGPKAAGQQQ